jgi:3-oxoacyl-[acyl-carrier protein] reductase
LPTKVVIVSGGSRGLGQVIVTSLLDDGCAVATFSRRATPFVTDAKRDRGLAERFHYGEVDIADSAQVREFVRGTHARFGRIDALINNASIATAGVFPLMSDDRIDAMLSINLRGSLLLSRECVRLMLRGGSGSIINIASIIGERGFSGLAAYSATKAGQIAMTRALARELGERNIRVNAIAPGYLETEMSEPLTSDQRSQIVRRTPLGRLGQAEDVVPCVRFLLSSGATFITGQVISIDGGLTA